MNFEAGHVIDGKYRISRVLGAGGMGAVYEGENIRIGRRVAIKVLHAEAASAPDLRRRFEREARVAAKIGSSNICDVLDLGDLDTGHAFLVMEYLEGETLDAFMTREPRLQAHEITPIVVQMLDGLSAMHGASIIHRDLKPANVFLTNTGVVKLLDFGISKFQVQTEEMGQKTETGALLGTPLYMSPEQSRGAELDGRSDLYCVGVILYRALAGHHCFEADNLPQLLFKTAIEEPIPLLPRVDAVDQSFVPIVEKAMAKKPEDRYQTARELRDAIDEWLREHHPEVGLPPAPARYEGVLEASGARGRFDGSGAYPRLGGSGSRPRFDSIPDRGNTPAGLGKAKSPLTPISVKVEEGGDTANSWEKVPVAGADTSDIALAKTSASDPPPAMPAASNAEKPAKKNSKVIGIAAAAAAVLVLAGVGLAMRDGGSKGAAVEPPPSAAPVAVPPPPPQAEAPVAAKPTAEPSAPATAAEGASAAQAVAPTPVAHGTKPATVTTPVAKASASSAPPTAATPPPPAAEPSNKPGRKIRTEL